MVDSENANQPFNKTVTCYDTLHFPPRLGNLTKLQSKSFRVEIMQDASRRACLKQRRCITLQAEGNNDGVVYCAPVR